MSSLRYRFLVLDSWGIVELKNRIFGLVESVVVRVRINPSLRHDGIDPDFPISTTGLLKLPEMVFCFGDCLLVVHDNPFKSLATNAANALEVDSFALKYNVWRKNS